MSLTQTQRRATRRVRPVLRESQVRCCARRPSDTGFHLRMVDRIVADDRWFVATTQLRDPTRSCSSQVWRASNVAFKGSRARQPTRSPSSRLQVRWDGRPSPRARELERPACLPRIGQVAGWGRRPSVKPQVSSTCMTALHRTTSLVLDTPLRARAPACFELSRGVGCGRSCVGESGR